MPVAVVSRERSFFQIETDPKLSKIYIMLQEILSSLRSSSIGNEIDASLDFSELIKIFAERNTRRANFGH